MVLHVKPSITSNIMYIAQKKLRSMSYIPTIHPRPRTRVRTSTGERVRRPDYISVITNRSAMPEAPSKPATAEPVLTLRFEPLYRIILHYSRWKEDDTKMITQKVKIGVPILTLRECEKIVKHTFSYGMSIVCTVTLDKAELYKDTLVRMGLDATLEEA